MEPPMLVDDTELSLGWVWMQTQSNKGIIDSQ